MGKRKDITGQRFGKLLAIKPIRKSNQNCWLWLCKCDCGNETLTSVNNLTSYNSTSCGCSRIKNDLTGLQFGGLAVIKRVDRNKHKEWCWLCRCVCGSTRVVATYDLKSGRAKSCGCLTPHPTLPRGDNAFNRIYYDYIRAAKKRNYEWLLSKADFKKLTKKNCYYCNAPPTNMRKSPRCNGHYIYNGIDRVDNNKGYTPDNVVPCCSACNVSKRHHTTKEFLDRVKRIYVNLNLGGA